MCRKYWSKEYMGIPFGISDHFLEEYLFEHAGIYYTVNELVLLSLANDCVTFLFHLICSFFFFPT